MDFFKMRKAAIDLLAGRKPLFNFAAGGELYDGLH